MTRILILLILIGCLAGCSSSKEDRKKLEGVCSIAATGCYEVCKESCELACNNGGEECLANMQEIDSSNWKPAEAFYEGCADSCTDTLCFSACQAGHRAAAAHLKEKTNR